MVVVVVVVAAAAVVVVVRGVAWRGAVRCNVVGAWVPGWVGGW